MTVATLQPFVRHGLDVLFVALNPPEQSNANGHYFSGRQSRFFPLLHLSGLITKSVDRATADTVVFGSNTVNYRGAQFGIVDLVPSVVETNSGRVRPTQQHVISLVGSVHEYRPRFVCVIHSKVRDALNDHARLARPLDYGMCGPLLPACPSQFVLNYFPNGNGIADAVKLKIFGELRAAL